MSVNGYTRVDNVNLTVAVTLPGKAAAVYLTLLSHRNQKTGLCNPSQELIAEECGIEPRHARRLLKTLSDAGLVTWLTQTSRQGRTSNKYVFPTPQVEDIDVRNLEDIDVRRYRTPMSSPTARTYTSSKQRRSEQDEERPDDIKMSGRYIPTECVHIWNGTQCTRCNQPQPTPTNPNQPQQR